MRVSRKAASMRRSATGCIVGFVAAAIRIIGIIKAE
jgi:hypothetical protein